MTLALFDLDNTLIAGDSDHLWGEFMCASGRVDEVTFAAKNNEFYAAYQRGNLDINAYLRFALGPMVGMSREQIADLQATFMSDWVSALMLPKAQSLLDKHRTQGHTLIVITATNTIVTEPIVRALGVGHLLGCEPEWRDGKVTGAVRGQPTFREGKVVRIAQWCREHAETLDDAWFYSDSHNDLPLLEAVDHAVAVDPDPTLASAASERGWPVISLRED